MSLLSRLAVQAARAYGILSAADKNKVVADYLVVAGGGGSGGGGGGAGGYQTSTANLSTLNTYSIAVGAGGSGVVCVGGGTSGIAGSNSSISGTGLSTITSVGGGYGGGGVNGGSGGSGGGSGSSGSLVGGGSGTSGQGNNGGGNGGFTSSPFPAGGGGGAGAVGGTATSTTQAGNGGVGLASSISGSSVYYAGGGGGGYYSTGGTATTGGTGGGGAGNSNTGNAVSGTANTGGGGGGTGPSYLGGSGGSGIVIISYTSATPKFVGGTITTSGGKQIHTFTSSGTLSPITPITASYLVVAGGGGAVGNRSGGGGAGGLLTSSTTLYSGATYIVTVGAGGAGGAGNAAVTSTQDGSNSVLSGTGLTTITATGGGGGGGTNNPSSGRSGGSGGGAGGDNATGATGGTGTSGQGFAGGTSAAGGGGGGGGASAVGSNGSSNTGGNGGAGTASSISGTSVTYAGGGGGGATTTAGTGGAGGGGNGAGGSPTTQSRGVDGTQNSGGGAGGGSNYVTTAVTQASGGSGIVIISYAGSQAFNGGLVTSSGGNTIHTFTSTGALTPLTNNLTNSLRFRSSASARLSRTFATTGTNNKIQTFSAWVKRGLLSSSTTYRLMGCYDGSSANSTEINFNNDTLRIEFGGAASNSLITTQVFRDPSAWYHIVIAIDTTQATAANRIKMYVNGNQITAFGTANYPSQNAASQLTSANANNSIGAGWSGFEYFDGYMTDINFIDGQALEPYYFGNNDANGVWKPILYKGTYGTNGFYLTFGNTTSTTTLGYDSSPNGNNWTCNNISLTAGTTYDAMTDVPTNTSATVANYPTLNPLSNTSTLTEANLSASNILLAGTTMATPSTGKWYFEYTQTTSIPSGSLWVGVSSNTNAVADNQLQGYSYASDGRKVAYNSYTSGYGSTWTNGDVIGCALDLDNQTITFYKNNVSQGTAFTSITAQPYVFALSAGGAASTKGGSINCGQRPFAYTPPTGFVALNTYNLPTPTILQGNKYMDATLWTGNATTNVIVNQSQFKPDFAWIKGRGNAENHALFDSVRGANKNLASNTTAIEGTQTDMLMSFNSNGFTLGADGNWQVNKAATTYVGWQWQAGQGSTSSNTSGSITSTVSVNTTAGFSVVTYTGNGTTGATIGHGLGVVPKMIIFKDRDSVTNWPVYHVSLGNATAVNVNQTNASFASSSFNSTTPTSTLITLGGNGLDVNNTSKKMLAYCWAEINGFSKFGSYTGNGSADGSLIYTGFKPKFIMIKCTDTAGTAWVTYDTARDTYNVAGNILLPNSSSAELSGYSLDILSNGFKHRQGGGDPNASGRNYIYACWASNPFKSSNAV